MLTALRLGNFKAFAETQRLPIKPLTLIFGANSAGKSSLIHGLLLARHAADTGELDVHRTAIGGDAVDLGGFRQYVYRRDATTAVEWGAELDASRLPGRLRGLLQGVQRVSVLATVAVATDDLGEPVRGSAPVVQAVELQGDGETMVRMSRRPDGDFRIDRLAMEHGAFTTLVRAIVETTTTANPESADLDALGPTAKELVSTMVVEAGPFLPRERTPEQGTYAALHAALLPVSRSEREDDLAAALRLFLPRQVDHVVGGTCAAVIAELERVRYLGPLRLYPPRHFAVDGTADGTGRAGGGAAWQRLVTDSKVLAAVNAWLGGEHLRTPYTIAVRQMIAADQLGAPLIRALEHLPTFEDFVRWQAGDDALRSFMREDGELDWRVAVDIESLTASLAEAVNSSDAERLPELVLTDVRRRTEVTHRDVGIGVSQVLPVLVEAFGARGEIVAIEQPELHLHPALQAELGDVFITSALGGQENRFILETHSEHLILRIMRRMRETANGTLPKDGDGRLPDIRPDDVSIVFVQPDGASARVLEIQLDEEGQLLTEWPGGFFEEGFVERFS